MDMETKSALEENLELSRENNKMLKKIISSQRWARTFRIFYWLIIIGASVGAYYYVQPYVEQILGGYQSLISGVDTIQKTTQSLPDASSLSSFFNSLRPK